MSKPDHHKLKRKNESFLAVSAFLDDRGIDFEVGRGAKHPFILVKTRDPFRLSICGTPSDYRAARNCIRDLKRQLAESEGRMTSDGRSV